MALLDYGTSGRHGLSYSRRGTLHACPRKFQIENVLGLKERHNSVTFAYGHSVAAGVQEYFSCPATLSSAQKLQHAVIATAKLYDLDWEDLGTASEQRGKKNVWYAINSTKQFCNQIESALVGDLAPLRGWKIAIMPNGKPAVEVQFRIILDNQYVYEGHIDLVLVNEQGEYAILELKTTTFKEPHEASYGRSDQALSYSIVLDHAMGYSKTSYKVFYLIYSSSNQQWILMSFNKNAKQRLDWINNLIRDTELIEYYQGGADAGIPYPTNGASCYNFFRECEYYRVCDMEDESLKTIYGAKPESQSFHIEDKATLIFTLDDIINSQIAKVEDNTGIEVTSTSHTGNNHAQFIEI
jgi:hypothetical protein